VELKRRELGEGLDIETQASAAVITATDDLRPQRNPLELVTAPKQGRVRLAKGLHKRHRAAILFCEVELNAPRECD
jgi:hypothetical protein